MKTANKAARPRNPGGVSPWHETRAKSEGPTRQFDTGRAEKLPERDMGRQIFNRDM